MTRIALGVEYDGSDFQGWQRQSTGRSVQASLEEAISRIADCPVAVHGAGRTDSGVHATAQIAHFDTPVPRPMRAWGMGVNTYLPRDVSVSWAREVPDDFHARFSARGRAYTYLILNRRLRSALHASRACWWHQALDAGRMHAGGQHLVGTHDFSSFRASECQARTARRTIRELRVWRQDDWVVLEVSADAFLHHMVRNIAGTLMRVGAEEETTDWPGDVLAAADRRVAGITAPAAGLYLVDVRYPDRYELPRGKPLSRLLPGQ